MLNACTTLYGITHSIFLATKADAPRQLEASDAHPSLRRGSQLKSFHKLITEVSDVKNKSYSNLTRD
jgi:hypothetical protein